LKSPPLDATAAICDNGGLKKKASKKETEGRDVAQNALSIVEQAKGGKLVEKPKPVRRKPKK
jgi:hypothetical protein